ncbi:hypothetical protein [Kitasatospora herbaricolor]|uniref:Uncharacterized protein n=1 Tax=Kitasatospora herbaricolor TaxID=68217 RepID=A0ABZ1W5A6_9ACTN|nr:hypothetical protein [Kitasatospora herbaricolor]
MPRFIRLRAPPCRPERAAAPRGRPGRGTSGSAGRAVTKRLSDHKGDAAGRQTIVIRQTGGKNIQSEDDALFQQGEQAVLFLREFAPGKYAVISGPNGRFRLGGSTGKAAGNGSPTGDVGDDSTVARFNDETAGFSGTLGQLSTLLAQP